MYIICIYIYIWFDTKTYPRVDGLKSLLTGHHGCHGFSDLGIAPAREG